MDALPDEVIDDPVWRRSGFTIRGRDGCRVPLPWAGDASPFGFSRPGVRTWLPQPAAWASLTVEAQERDPGSTLALYRAALALRHVHPGLAGAGFRWVRTPPGVLAFERGAGFECLVNVSDDPLPISCRHAVLPPERLRCAPRRPAADGRGGLVGPRLRHARLTGSGHGASASGWNPADPRTGPALNSGFGAVVTQRNVGPMRDRMTVILCTRDLPSEALTDRPLIPIPGLAGGREAITRHGADVDGSAANSDNSTRD